MLTLIIACIIGIGSILLAIIQYYEKSEQRKEAEVQEAEAKKYRKQFEEAVEEIKTLQKENKELSQELYKTAIGYNSYPIIAITANRSRAFKNSSSEETIEFNIIEFNLINSGDYPLADVEVQFSDPYFQLIGQYVSVGKNSIAQKPDARYDLTNPSRELKIGSIPKNEILRQVYITTLPKEFSATYNVKVVWRSGNIEYSIDVKDETGKIGFTYSQIHSSDIEIDRELLSKKITENFTMNHYIFK